jgi:hypothetical protein
MTTSLHDLHPPERPADIEEPTPEPIMHDTELFLGSVLGSSEAEWEAHHPLSPRSRRRQYILEGIAAVLGVAIAWWQSSWLILFMVIFAIAAWELRERFSKPVRVRVDAQGMTIDDYHYPHATLSSFDLHRTAEDRVELSVAIDQWPTSTMRVPLGDQDPDEVHAILSRYIPHALHEVPLVDRLLHGSPDDTKEQA